MQDTIVHKVKNMYYNQVKHLKQIMNHMLQNSVTTITKNDIQTIDIGLLWSCIAVWTTNNKQKAKKILSQRLMWQLKNVHSLTYSVKMSYANCPIKDSQIMMHMNVSQKHSLTAYIIKQS